MQMRFLALATALTGLAIVPALNGDTHKEQYQQRQTREERHDARQERKRDLANAVREEFRNNRLERKATRDKIFAETRD